MLGITQADGSVCAFHIDRMIGEKGAVLRVAGWDRGPYGSDSKSYPCIVEDVMFSCIFLQDRWALDFFFYDEQSLRLDYLLTDQTDHVEYSIVSKSRSVSMFWHLIYFRA